MRTKLIIFGILITLLVGCSSNPLNRFSHSKVGQGAVVGVVGGAAAGGALGGGTGATIGAAVGGVAGTLIGYERQKLATPQERLAAELMFHGVTVLNIGDEFLVSIPSRKLFYGTSPRVRWSSYPLLNLVADYLKCHPKVGVMVGGYTDNQDDPRRDMALSRARAQNVANYLWSQAIDTRLLTAQGYGQASPIASNKTLQGRDWNERIEVRFRSIEDFA